LSKNQKVDYWFYYYENGNKKKEGYQDNKKINGGFFMNQIRISKKNEFKTIN
jgi:hypothetical protein